MLKNIINNNSIKHSTRLCDNYRFYSNNSNYSSSNGNNDISTTLGRQQNEEVEKEWFLPNDDLVKYHKDTVNINKSHIVYLEGPSGSGKTQLLERIGKLGYTTISHPFLKFIGQQSTDKDVQSKWNNEIKNDINKLLIHKHKNDLIFIHRSPISSIIYGDTSKKVDETIKSIKEYIKSEEWRSSIIYCDTPIELIEQRTQGRYHFLDQNEQSIVDHNQYFSQQRQSFANDCYQEIKNDKDIVRANLITISIKQACPGLLALFNIYYTPSFQIPPRPTTTTTKVNNK